MLTGSRDSFYIEIRAAERKNEIIIVEQFANIYLDSYALTAAVFVKRCLHYIPGDCLVQILNFTQKILNVNIMARYFGKSNIWRWKTEGFFAMNCAHFF